MLKMLRSLLDENAKVIKKLSKMVNQINDLEEDMLALTEDELKDKTAEFRSRLEEGETLDDLLPEAFAVVRQASQRVLGMRHFDVQLMGGMVLHQGRIAEMKTGEGKTLVATLPVYLNALAGSVHVVTVNDYLASRDSEWMGQLYKYLGLTVGLIVHGLDHEQRREAYACDVVYGTNNEFGFDYLRDNMAMYGDQLVQGDLNYAIIDEVDSILIDEARTPLIISGQSDKATDLYYTVTKIIPRLKKEEHYTMDEKANVVTLTEEGVAKVEQMLGVENLYDDKHMELSHHVNQALRAHVMMKRDRDYVVKDGQVVIVDEFTGRLMFGRRFSEGLHQSIEAKEGVKIERESQTLATITFQNFFRMYNKLAGMTGTAETEEQEFRKIYGLDVVVMPTNEPMIREDLSDLVYRTEQGKFNAAVEEIAEKHEIGQPVLVGTISIEFSEHLSKLLKQRGVPHNVLNAKHHEKEAEIVAQAGRFGSVTIATNMAGRGTDIVLGGNAEFLAQQELPEGAEPDEMAALIEKKKETAKVEREKVLAAGGLHIIGTERHESRRIDNQLRGRSGRQGDPGSSRFYVSLEDDLMRLFGSDNISGIMDKLGMDDSTPIDHPLISRSIESAQKKVEARNFDIRKHVLEYDDVMNQQREVIYDQRLKVLMGNNLKETVIGMIETVIDGTVDLYGAESNFPENWDLKSMLDYVEQLFLPGHDLTEDQMKNMDKEDVREMFKERALALYEQREEELSAETMRELERMVILKVVDAKWMDHLDAMDQLRQGIGLRAVGQQDPLVAYKKEGYEMFNDMIASIQDDVVRYVYRVKVVERPEERQNVVENRYSEDQEMRPVRNENKVGRNDPCPCGSGKKYKKCCGRN
ncbi:preprotein translocase subunit SecA [Metallumcola ferriviriculae]|uniref:Protein translocase subunit SecA n=1 Tax=Metallumcola ferriviriculae TaxID=3039180 RepID=A0AAU0UM27_9FIRM|nr:preprotein translocase subunit SecA [Desulfitibacteraceae bacterium MK1]